MFNKAIKNVGQLQNVLKKAQRAQKLQKKVEEKLHTKLFEKKLPCDSFIYMNGQFDIRKVVLTEQLVKDNSIEELENILTKNFNVVYNQVDEYRVKELEKVNQEFDEKTIKMIGDSIGKKAATQIEDGMKAQELAKEKQKEFAVKIFEDEFAQGNIKIKMLGSCEIQKLTIKPDFVDFEDMEMLEDSMIYAMKKMYEIVDNERTIILNEATKSLNIDKVNV
jgi:DNA-binding protein YbaB